MNDARDLEDKTVLVKLLNYDGLEFVGVPEKGPFFCRVVAVDEAGLWVENKNFITTELSDSTGAVVPEERRKTERHVVNVLLPWRNIQTVVMFTEDDAENIVQGLIDDEKGGTGTIGFVK
ncbi:MAG TPA: hypothetical protein VMX58_02300 [Patescibacteria group bacterium]|nr:hypothetical protein [Patescibacteria group bacterium]